MNFARRINSSGDNYFVQNYGDRPHRDPLPNMSATLHNGSGIACHAHEGCRPHDSYPQQRCSHSDANNGDGGTQACAGLPCEGFDPSGGHARRLSVPLR